MTETEMIRAPPPFNVGIVAAPSAPAKVEGKKLTTLGGGGARKDLGHVCNHTPHITVSTAPLHRRLFFLVM